MQSVKDSTSVPIWKISNGLSHRARYGASLRIQGKVGKNICGELTKIFQVILLACVFAGALGLTTHHNGITVFCILTEPAGAY